MLEPKKLAATIEFARKLHGHVGPYLVIGLKMGAAAKKALNISDTECTHLTAEAAVPLHPPFSCLPRRHTGFHNLHNRQPKTQNQKLKNHSGNL